MSKLNNVWVVAESISAISELSSAALRFGENTALVYAGERSSAKNVSKAYHLENVSETSFAAYLPALARFLSENAPNLILIEATNNGRLLSAMIAASVKTSALTDVSELYVAEDGSVMSKRMVYGGAAFKTEKSSCATAVACVGASVFEADVDKPATEIIPLSLDAVTGIRAVGKHEKQVVSVNLSAAKKIVCVGRGVGDAEGVEKVRDFAAKIDAELGCTRPVAEDDLMPHECYVGVSGVMLKPDVYVGVGVSGQVQHMVGVNQASTIIAVNKDKNAPIFKQCDYGIVGDYSEVLPKLLEQLQ